ncbi:MAG: hypothetical protein CMB64_06620 [Euryarchaeota archaeon]|nr:hypothetical protein [Euryarchaeota archaeon]
MTVHLLDTTSFLKISQLKWGDVYDSAQNARLRELRPNPDSKLIRSHDIDSEVELLDWMDSLTLVDNDFSFIKTITNAINNGEINFETGCEGIYHLIELCSVGYWEIWESRSYLYFEKVLEIKVENIEELYAEQIWINLMEKMIEITADDFSELVVMDWMRRREELGETLDEKKDPRILPTLASHKKLTNSLHYLLNNCHENSSYQLIVGRDHLNKSKWGHGDWNIGNLLQKN